MDVCGLGGILIIARPLTTLAETITFEYWTLRRGHVKIPQYSGSKGKDGIIEGNYLPVPRVCRIGKMPRSRGSNTAEMNHSFVF